MYLRFRSNSVFLIGFAFGFIVTVLFSLAQNISNGVSGCEKSLPRRNAPQKRAFPKLFISAGSPDDEIILRNWPNLKNAELTYRRWLREKNLNTNDVDLDEYLYGPKTRQQVESGWLRSKIHVTCVVFVKKMKSALSVKNTWGRRCNNLYFFGHQLEDPEIPVINVGVKILSSWQLLCEALNYVSRESRTLEWLIFVKDETVVIPENLRYMVAPLDHNDDHYLGHAVVMWGLPYNVAQAGYVISGGAFRKLVDAFNDSKRCETGGKYWNKEDYDLAKHLLSLGIHPSDTRDQHLRGTFHGYSLQNLLWGVVKAGSYWTHALYPIQEDCCSPLSVTFSAGESDKMYTLDYLLYHLRVVRSKAAFGARSAPMPVPEDEVWKIALKEEFNITYPGDISSDAYYEIWHSKYSKPEQLIAKNYRSMPEVLSSVLTAYELERRNEVV